MRGDALTDQAACSNESFYNFVKRAMGSFIPYQLMIWGQIPRQWIIPSGFPLHLSSLLQIVRAFLPLLFTFEGASSYEWISEKAT
jgi:hypothetical protein